MKKANQKAGIAAWQACRARIDRGEEPRVQSVLFLKRPGHSRNHPRYGSNASVRPARGMSHGLKNVCSVKYGPADTDGEPFWRGGSVTVVLLQAGIVDGSNYFRLILSCAVMTRWSICR